MLTAAMILLLAQAPAETVFSGAPAIKISEGGLERTVEAVTPHDAPNLACVISRIGDGYYWASRGNKRMTRVDAKGFTTFFAEDGAGYVRAIRPGMKQIVSLFGETEVRYDYVEHLLIGLKSVTNYGREK